MNTNKQDDKFNCDVIFTNNSPKNSKFSLTLYLNYNQISFDTNESEYSNTYDFDLDSNNSKTISISIPTEQILYENNSLIFNITAGIDKHACNVGEPTNSFGINAEYNLKLDTSETELENQLVPDSEYTPITINNNFSGIIMNQDFKTLNEIHKPNNAIHVQSGQDVKLALRFGGYANINNYLLFLILNNEQISINGSQKYLLFKDLDSNLKYKIINFKAPEKKGQYELWTLMAKNPLQFQDNPLTSRRRSLDYSHRITLIVE
ncbi:hypothetical protein FDB47_16265 [Clostridium botulinum]|nr:hypothetical protein [Clostridium botulinum]